MSERSQTLKKNKLLQSILDWQTELGIEGWNQDKLKDSTGIVIDENSEDFNFDDGNFTIISEDGEVEVQIKSGEFNKYTVSTTESGLYSISKK